MAYQKLDARQYTYEEIMALGDPEWRVEGFLEDGSCIFISAQPKVGKSFFALRLAGAISAGLPLFGYSTKQGNVTYLAAERSNLMKRRVQALQRRDLPFNPQHFTMYPHPVMFANPDAVRAFARSLRVVPDVLIVDTLRRCNDGPETDNTHMGKWTAGIEYFRDLTGSSVVVVHHDHKQQHNRYGTALETTFSGAGAILGNLDGYFSLRPQENGTIIIGSEGSNELSEFLVTARIENVQLGTDREGKPFGTGVMVEVDADGVIEDKPDIWPLVKDVLREHQPIHQAALTDKCRESEPITRHWPRISPETISNLVKDNADELIVTKEGNKNMLTLKEAA